MKTSIEILDAIGRAHGASSDYRIAKLTGISPSKISAVRAGRCSMSRTQCKRAAAALGVEPGALIAIAQAEREEDPEIRDSLLRVAGGALAAAAPFSRATPGTPTGARTKARQAAQDADPDCLLCKLPAVRRRWLLRLAPPRGLPPVRQSVALFSSRAA